MTINVFIVDDSATARTALKLILEDTDDINVVGTASNPLIALKRMKLKRWPDVIISDLEMPEMDGISFLKHIQRNQPTPFIVFSNHTGASAMSSVEALSYGAVDIIPKPDFSCEQSLKNAEEHMLHAIRAAAKTQNSGLLAKSFRERKAKRAENKKTQAHISLNHNALVIAIGSSTGGTTIIEKILTALPINSPPVVIVQHMPEHFTAAFAKRINQFCKIEVKEAVHGDKLLPGNAFIAPGGKHMRVKNTVHDTEIAISNEALVNRHCPSIDILFDSVAKCYSKRATGIILTGMGKDGAKGLLHMYQKGAFTIAQAQDGCAVYGMPKAAVAIDAVSKEMTVDEIIDFLVATDKGSLE